MHNTLPRSDRGFTLVEVMIVVAIIGILASVAIPGFSRYQLRAKSSEVKTNLAAIRIVEETIYGENGFYVSAAAEPAMIPGSVAAVFDTIGSDFAGMGWSPQGNVYFSYAVEISADATGYTADAGADIDANGILQLWGYAKPDVSGAIVPAGIGCNTALLAPEVLGSCVVGNSTF